MCMYVYVCVYVCVYVYICMCMCVYIYIYLCICMYIYISHAGVGMWIAGLSFIAVQYIGEGGGGGMIFFTKSLSFIVWKLLI